ncbi:hypothetical protein C8Q80DRAFT_1120155 [Daedaleopsis nitida]|nr:hypothetical protein C8Q80DRAFT_1120155 [Daedaleopsis nitida]
MTRLTILSAVALACAVAVQGASLGGNATLVARACDQHDTTPPKCETSGGSPLASDCVEALKRLSGQCVQSNDSRPSQCQTQVTYGTCKIDACGETGAKIADGVNCGGYLQSILNECQSGGRVGGYLAPTDCNVQTAPLERTQADPAYTGYKLQFSHT